ncbi:MAG: BACON domain-containing protein [Prevotellaceae bacterium]|jgi:hypothetical protein|nr:BACON domain-containing protein [Prevotellaceae bacterium]
MKQKHYIRIAPACLGRRIAMLRAAGLALLLAVAASCAEELQDEPAALVEAQLSFSAAGGAGFVRISAAQGVEASTDQPSWCAASVTRDSVKVAVAANTGMSGRTALLTILAGGKTFFVPVTQEGAILTTSESEVLFEGSGGRKAIAVKNTVGKPYSVALRDSAGWLSYALKGDSLVFTASPSDVRKRTDTAILTMGEGKDSRTLRLTVEQLSFAGPYIASYYDYDAVRHTDTVAVAAGGSGIYYIENLKPNNASNVQNYRNRILCTYSNKKMTMNAGQTLQKIEYISPVTHAPDSVTLRLLALNRSREAATFSIDAFYSAEVAVDDATTSITLSFGNSGDEWRGIAIEGIATGGINAAGQYVGRFDSYIYLTLVSREELGIKNEELRITNEELRMRNRIYVQ